MTIIDIEAAPRCITTRWKSRRTSMQQWEKSLDTKEVLINRKSKIDRPDNTVAYWKEYEKSKQWSSKYYPEH